MLEANYEAKLEFPAERGVGWGGGAKTKNLPGRGKGTCMDIFWKCTMSQDLHCIFLGGI